MEANGSNGLYQLTINPGPNYVIGNGDAVFLLGDSYQDAVLVWKYVGQAYENSEAGKLVSSSVVCCPMDSCFLQPRTIRQ